MQAPVAKGLEAAIAMSGSANAMLEAKPIEMHEVVRGLAGVVASPPLDVASMTEMTKMFGRCLRRDKQRTDSMLNPHPDRKSGEWLGCNTTVSLKAESGITLRTPRLARLQVTFTLKSAFLDSDGPLQVGSTHSIFR